MARGSCVETNLKNRRPRTYRRLDSVINNRLTPVDTRRMATFELKLLLPQIRRDANDAYFSRADRSYMTKLVTRYDAAPGERTALHHWLAEALSRRQNRKLARI